MTTFSDRETGYHGISRGHSLYPDSSIFGQFTWRTGHISELSTGPKVENIDAYDHWVIIRKSQTSQSLPSQLKSETFGG